MSGPERLNIRVSAEEEGTRLDKLLSTAPAIGSRTVAQRMIAAGQVTVDGERRSKNYQVRAGEAVAAEVPAVPDSTLEPESMKLDIPFEDEYLLVVDKPPGIVTHPARGHATGTLVHGLLAHRIAGGDSPQRPGIVHRLDKDTSGLMVVARDSEAHRRLAAMFARHEVERTYLALVHGTFATREGTVDAPVGRDSSRRKQMSVATQQGREAVTHFRVVDSWAGDGVKPRGKGSSGFSLLEVRLETGRTHQIRVHLAAIGHPVAGDGTYGQRRDVLGVGRQFLHSARIRFEHPLTGETIELESPLPPDLQAALDRLGE
ncbi:MAG: RluA family pseudouridine synthase [Thermoleophilia bacterium]